MPSQLPKLIDLSELPESYKPMVDLEPDYHPKKDSPDDYMNDRQLEYFRRKLVKWRSDLLADSMKTIENLREEARDVGDEAERASRETENSLELRARDRARKLINKIDNVLRLVDEHRYGYCEETDEEIGIDRLDARPIATLCLDAQERREHQQKHIGEG